MYFEKYIITANPPLPPHPTREYPARVIVKILKKPKAIVQGFFFGGPKNELRKVIHLKVNEKIS